MSNKMGGMTMAALRALLDGDIENAIVASTPGGIVRQEKQGQAALVKTDILPKECNDEWEKLEALGIERLGDYDDLFYKVRLPAGWSKQVTEHDMHTNLLDEQGRKRAGIFYKAAFYDRRADISLERRYTYDVRPKDGYTDDYQADYFKPQYGCVLDCGKVVWQTEWSASRPTDSDREQSRVFYAAQDGLYAAAEAWLVKHYPDYKNPLVYW